MYTISIHEDTGLQSIRDMPYLPYLFPYCASARIKIARCLVALELTWDVQQCDDRVTYARSLPQVLGHKELETLQAKRTRELPLGSNHWPPSFVLKSAHVRQFCSFQRFAELNIGHATCWMTILG